MKSSKSKTIWLYVSFLVYQIFNTWYAYRRVSSLEWTDYLVIVNSIALIGGILPFPLLAAVALTALNSVCLFYKNEEADRTAIFYINMFVTMALGISYGKKDVLF